MSGIICCACSISAISVLQCALKQWRNDLNTVQVKNESQQNRDQWWAFLQGTVARIILDSNKKAPDSYFHEQFMESFSSASKLLKVGYDDRARSSQEWKTEIKAYDRSGRPDKTSWRMARKVRPGFSHEETPHDGTAQSVVNKETSRDRSGRPDVDSQEEAWPQQFVNGNDEAELELSVE